MTSPKSTFPLPFEPWMDGGRCAEVDPELFYPERETARHVAQAKVICGGCEFTLQCFTYAIRHRIDFGVWGGYTSPERQKLLAAGARRRAARRAAEVIAEAPAELDEAA